MATAFFRSVIAKALAFSQAQLDTKPSIGAAGDPEMHTRFSRTAEQIARDRWGNHSVPALLRTAVGSISSEPLATIGAKDDEFFARVFERSLVGRLGLREVPFNVRTLRMGSGSTGYWVGESKAIPLSKPVLTGSTLPRKKVGVLWLATNESLEHAHPATERPLEDDGINAIVGATDMAFLDPANGGTADMPPAVTHGAPSLASTGDPSVDVASLIAAFTGDLATAVFVTSPTIGAQLALARDPLGSHTFPDAGPRGGSIVGMPLLTTRWSPDQIALIDPAGIAARIEAIEVARSNAAKLECDDEPTGASDTPTGATKAMISLFQNDLTAFRALVYANWEAQRPSVVVVTGCDYVSVIPAT